MRGWRRRRRADRWKGSGERASDLESSEAGEEIDFHLERRAAELVAVGMSKREAWDRALAEFGDVESARAELTRMDRRRTRRRRRLAIWSELWLDVRFAVRSVARRPMAALVLLLTLGVGLGSASGIFAVANAVLRRALPYRSPERLVHVWETYGNGGGESEASYPDYEDWREQSAVFAGLEGYDPTNVTVAAGDSAAMVRGARVSAGFFDVLGVVPMLGRTFLAVEQGPEADVVVLDHRYWRNELGGDGSVLERTLRIDGREYRIAGVLPPGFQFAPAGDAALWLPLDRGGQTLADRRNHWFNVVGRLADGETIATARSALTRIMDRLARAYPETNAGRQALDGEGWAGAVAQQPSVTAHPSPTPAPVESGIGRAGTERRSPLRVLTSARA